MKECVEGKAGYCSQHSAEEDGMTCSPGFAFLNNSEGRVVNTNQCCETTQIHATKNERETVCLQKTIPSVAKQQSDGQVLYERTQGLKTYLTSSSGAQRYQQLHDFVMDNTSTIFETAADPTKADPAYRLAAKELLAVCKDGENESICSASTIKTAMNALEKVI